MEHKCPWCGGDLPENASFCPHCAQFTRPREEAAIPRPRRKKVLLGLLLLAALLAVGAGLWLTFSPNSLSEISIGEQEIYISTDEYACLFRPKRYIRPIESAHFHFRSEPSGPKYAIIQL